MSSGIDLVIEARSRVLVPGLSVRRALPFVKRRNVGPFVFVDHMGPVDLPVAQQADVAPHPHIGLATVTYLFEGRVLHRDSIGNVQVVAPGDASWMTAGRGIVHSERAPAEDRDRPSRLHGLQTWVALPKEFEETDPSLHHHPRATLPEIDVGNVRVRVVAGNVFGVTSPVKSFSPLFFADLVMPEREAISIDTDHEERAIYVVSGEITIGSETIAEGAMAVLTPGRSISIRATKNSRAIAIGGAPLDSPRFMFWNFVSSDRARLDRAADDWRASRFSRIDGDEEAISIPDGTRRPRE